MFKKYNLLDIAVILLVLISIVLVIFIISWVHKDTKINKEYSELVCAKLEQIQYITIDTVVPKDSLALTGKDIKDMLDDIVLEESTIMDSNNYLAIILTLITLCVSLSVVIPYILGKSVSSKEIRDVVDDVYKRDKHNIELKYQKYVEQLLLAEGHLSRITAYHLLCSAQGSFPKVLRKERYNVRIHPYWALGWASKSLIRYMICYKENKNNYNAAFIADSVKYIKDSINAVITQDLSPETLKEAKDKMIRTFIDVLDVLGFGENSDVLSKEQSKDLHNAMKTLYLKMRGSGISKEDIMDIAVKKSKYQNYLSPKEYDLPTVREFKWFLNDMMEKLENNG